MMANARKHDPETSHEAADSVSNKVKTQSAILRILFRPLTDEVLIGVYEIMAGEGLAPKASQSGIRSRRSELVDMGLIEAKGYDMTLFGRRAIVWGLK